MDLEANMKEQRELAQELIDLWDECPENGEPTDEQVEAVYEKGIRLAELVQALETQRQGGNSTHG